MDSVTQFALGAGVGLAVLGRRVGPRKAAVVGGVLGTLPDLDVLVPFGDPVDEFVLHRAASHSLIVHAAVTPLLGEGLVRIFRALRARRALAYAAIYLCVATHALLDALTVYGTRIFWPLWTEPIAIGSIFIIDPVYTLPLLMALVWAACLRAWTPRFGTALTASLLVSTAYLGWSLVAQQTVQARAAKVLRESGIRIERTIATPTPFNTLFWRVIAVQPDRYFNVYVPVFGTGPPSIHMHPRGGALAACLRDNEAFGKLARFSHGFFSLERIGRTIVLSDLRMGLPPNYAFRFAIAEQGAGGIRPLPPRRVIATRGVPGDIDWLLANLAAGHAVRPAEADAAVTPSQLAALPPAGDGRVSC